MKLLRLLARVPEFVLVTLVRGYQLGISPLIGHHCRFKPSCSQYYILAVKKYGAIRGSWRGIKRIARCHPWNPGGYDPP
ncbi:membrane protein insertion efficiency factor YidD [Aeoliella sp.]|uniref:membrane protein insertion efficiency factor YidD n=1 Tax=Aeoliella sp. TaxID=2795800 RepID=UPI003CCBC6FE